MKRRIIFALMILMTPLATMADDGHSNPSASEKPPVTNSPSACTGKEAHSWCRSGKEEAKIKEARSAQARPTDGPSMHFAGINGAQGSDVHYSSLKPSR